MKKMMKKAFLLMVLMFVPFAMQAQTKFHDVEANEATGPVKSMSVSGMMGNTRVINFTPDGKMQQEGIKDAVYDADGYLQSFKMEMQGMGIEIGLKWENGRVKTQIMKAMGNETPINFVYGDKGEIVSQNMSFGGQDMSIPFTDYVFDDHGNWISRKSSMMGQENTETRKIEYYE